MAKFLQPSFPIQDLLIHNLKSQLFPRPNQKASQKQKSRTKPAIFFLSLFNFINFKKDNKKKSCGKLLFFTSFFKNVIK